MKQKQHEWNPDKALVQITAAKQYVENLMEQASALRGSGSYLATATTHFLGMDGLFVIEMGLKGIIACEDNESMVDNNHSTKELYEQIKDISPDAVQAIEAVWHGKGSFHAYMVFLDGKYNKWRYNFVEVGKDHENVALHAENMMFAIATLRDVLASLIYAKYRCECGSVMIKEGVKAYCASCGKRREEYDGDAQNHLIETIRSKPARKTIVVATKRLERLEWDG